MSYKIVVAVTPGTTSNVNIPNPNIVSGMKLSNGTPFDLDVDGFGSSGLVIVPAGTEYMLYASDGNRGKLYILPVNNNNVTGTGVVNINVYEVGEQVPKGTWPITIPTQTVKANVSTITNLINTGNAAGTQIIQIKETGSTGDNFSVLNDGTVDIRQYFNPTLTELFQIIPDATLPTINIGVASINSNIQITGLISLGPSTNVAGGLVINGQNGGGVAEQVNLNFAGNQFLIKDSAGNTSFLADATAGVDIQFCVTGKTAQCNGQLEVKQNLLADADLFVTAGTIHTRGQTLTRIFYGSGNGNGTITHNQGVGPSIVAVTYNTGATQAASPAWNNANANTINVFAAAVAWTAVLIWS